MCADAMEDSILFIYVRGRFVRFVSTPEILERFMRLEREILQIESSIQSNECSNGNSEEGMFKTY